VNLLIQVSEEWFTRRFQCRVLYPTLYIHIDSYPFGLKLKFKVHYVKPVLGAWTTAMANLWRMGGAMAFFGRFFAFLHGLPSTMDNNTSLQLSISRTYPYSSLIYLLHPSSTSSTKILHLYYCCFFHFTCKVSFIWLLLTCTSEACGERTTRNFNFWICYNWVGQFVWTKGLEELKEKIIR
jgi:hypothetical protein